MSEAKKGLELGPAIRKSKGESVTAVINLDDGASIELAYMDPEDMRSLRKRSLAMSWDTKKKQFDSYDDKKQFDILLADEAILNFNGMFIEGEEVTYSKENARMLMLHSFIFGEIVHRYVTSVNYFIKKVKTEQAEEITKN
jgi:hypothetical protein